MMIFFYSYFDTQISYSSQLERILGFFLMIILLSVPKRSSFFFFIHIIMEYRMFIWSSARTIKLNRRFGPARKISYNKGKNSYILHPKSASLYSLESRLFSQIVNSKGDRNFVARIQRSHILLVRSSLSQINQVNAFFRAILHTTYSWESLHHFVLFFFVFFFFFYFNSFFCLRSSCVFFSFLDFFSRC